MLVWNVFTVAIIFFWKDWCECVGECAQHHNMLLMHLLLGSKVVLFVTNFCGRMKPTARKEGIVTACPSNCLCSLMFPSRIPCRQQCCSFSPTTPGLPSNYHRIWSPLKTCWSSSSPLGARHTLICMVR